MAADLPPNPHWLLNVAREADAAACDEAFARRYKAARRAVDADRRRQALNQALETLRDPAARAAAEAAAYHVPLDPAGRLPEVEDLLAALLPLTPPADFAPLQAVPAPPTATAVAPLLDRPLPPWPDDQELLRRLAARLVIERLDPWELER